MIADSRLPHSTSRNLLFSAGDLSGDIHSGRLAHEVLRRHPDWKIYALGGSHLRDAGAEILRDTSGYGVIGIASAVLLLPGIPRLKRQLIRFLNTHQIDAAVLCDWGAFNVRLARLLQEHNVPVLYYFPPSSWQKTGDKGLSIAPLVQRVATPFEWSAQRLESVGCDAEWVGHPLLEIVEEKRQLQTREALRREFGASQSTQGESTQGESTQGESTQGESTQGESTPLIAILPGSRAMELKTISPHVAGAVRLLQQEYSSWRFVVAVPGGAAEKVRAYFPKNVLIVENRATEVLLACDAAIVKSGTATLEAAVCNAPQVVVYDVPPLLRAQIKLTGMDRKVKAVAMPNIILGEKRIPELLGDDCRPPRIAKALSTLLQNEAERAAQIAAYERVRRALGAELPYTATGRTAEILDEMLQLQR